MCGLMARNTVVGNGGPGEDWISNDYFPPWNINGNEVRWDANGVRYDIEEAENHSGNCSDSMPAIG